MSTDNDCLVYLNGELKDRVVEADAELGLVVQHLLVDGKVFEVTHKGIVRIVVKGEVVHRIRDLEAKKES